MYQVLRKGRATSKRGFEVELYMLLRVAVSDDAFADMIVLRPPGTSGRTAGKQRHALGPFQKKPSE